MTIEMLQILSISFYILAGLMFMISVMLFFVLDIRKVIGDVSGATARRAINDIRQRNEESGDKAYKPSPINAARGKLTDKISASGRLMPQFESYGGAVGTEKFDTTKLAPSANETTLLSGQTALLSEQDFVLQDQVKMENTGDKFEVDVEMEFLGSTEIIE